MYKELIESLNKTMKGLKSSLEDIEKQLSKDEVKFIEGYKSKLSKAMNDRDVNSLNGIIKDLQNFTNKKESKWA